MSLIRRIFLMNSGGSVINPSTSDAQADGTQKTQIVDGSNNTIASALHDAVRWLLVASLPAGWAIAVGALPSHKSQRGFGFNNTISTTMEDITESGAVNIPLPATAIAMEVISSNAQDVGTVLSSGTSTGGSTSTLIDSGATFVSDGVVAGDVVLNDTDTKIGTITTVDSEIQVTVVPTSSITYSGKAYRIVTAAGTGASVMECHNLDGNFDDIEEFVVLNGTTGVALASNVLRTNNFHVEAVGSGGVAVGNIDLQNSGGGTIYNRVPAGGNMTSQCQFTVKAGFDMFITDWLPSSSGAKPIQFFLRVESDYTDQIYLPGVFQFHDTIIVADNGVPTVYPLPIRVPPKATVKVSGKALGGAGGVGASSFGFWIEPA